MSVIQLRDKKWNHTGAEVRALLWEGDAAAISGAVADKIQNPQQSPLSNVNQIRCLSEVMSHNNSNNLGLHRRARLPGTAHAQKVVQAKGRQQGVSK